LIDPPVSPDYARRRLPVRGMAWKIGVGRVYDAAAAIGRPAPTRPLSTGEPERSGSRGVVATTADAGRLPTRAASARDPARGSRCAAWKIGPAALVLSVAPSPDVIRATAKDRGDSELMRVSVAIAAAPAIGTPPARFSGSRSRRAQVARGQGRPPMRRTQVQRRHGWCAATVSPVISGSGKRRRRRTDRRRHPCRHCRTDCLVIDSIVHRRADRLSRRSHRQARGGEAVFHGANRSEAPAMASLLTPRMQGHSPRSPRTGSRGQGRPPIRRHRRDAKARRKRTVDQCHAGPPQSGRPRLK